VITINTKTIATWHLAKRGDFDFIACLYRNDQDQQMFAYRFRYYDDPDNPQWWLLVPIFAEDEPTVEQTILGIIHKLEEDTGQKADVIRMRNGDVEAFQAELLSKPYTQISSFAPATTAQVN